MGCLRIVALLERGNLFRSSAVLCRRMSGFVSVTGQVSPGEI